MRVDEVSFVKAELSARLFAVELGITDFTRELRDEELAVLLCAGHFDAHGIKLAEITALLRWLGGYLAAFELMTSGPPALITFLDYHDVVCSFVRDEGYALGVGAVPMREIMSRPCRSVSTAFSLQGVLAQQRRAEERLRTTARIQRPSSRPA